MTYLLLCLAHLLYFNFVQVLKTFHWETCLLRIHYHQNETCSWLQNISSVDDLPEINNAFEATPLGMTLKQKSYVER